MRFGLVSRADDPRAVELAGRVADFLRERGARVVMSEEPARALGVKGVPLKDLRSDILVAIGGDGTILKALQECPDPGVGVFGINAGMVGFLTEVGMNEALPSLERILKKDYIIDARIRLSVEVNRARLCSAVNEAVVHTANVSKMLWFEVIVSGSVVEEVRADGIILATPTGSTCYAMSVGGPIVDPGVKAFIIAPIAPFKLAARPLLIPVNGEVFIKLLEPKPSILVVDGQYTRDITNEDIIRLTKAKTPARFIRFTTDFYRRLGERLVMY